MNFIHRQWLKTHQHEIVVNEIRIQYNNNNIILIMICARVWSGPKTKKIIRYSNERIPHGRRRRSSTRWTGFFVVVFFVAADARRGARCPTDREVTTISAARGGTRVGLPAAATGVRFGDNARTAAVIFSPYALLVLFMTTYNYQF